MSRRRAQHSDPPPDYSDAERVRLIKKAFEWCGQEYTQEDVAKQFRYETGRDLPSRKEQV